MITATVIACTFAFLVVAPCAIGLRIRSTLNKRSQMEASWNSQTPHAQTF